LNGNFDADFLSRFPCSAFFEGLQKIEFAAYDAPAAGFGRAVAQCEQHTIQFVHQQYADTNSRNIRIVHGHSLVRGVSRRVTQHRKELFCEREDAEKERGVDGVTGEGIAE
jgi:hypothetical protein